jgi:transposase-like protein
LGLIWFIHNHHSQEYATMAESTNATIEMPALAARDVLSDILRQGAQQMLAAAIEAEVAEWIDARSTLTDEQGHRQVVRNGYHNKRNIVTGLGPLEVEQPRVHDRRSAEAREKFSSKTLPPYLRKTKTIEELLPWLYLKGISTGDMNEALQSLLGADCPGLSASTVTSLKKTWEGEFKEWNDRSLKDKEYVYVWADGVHFNIRLEEDRQCILVLMGATKNGKKELIAIQDGFRESEQSWKELLLDVKARGLSIDPKLAIGDGALGFWKALPQVFESTREQRCWVHKTANILDKRGCHCHIAQQGGNDCGVNPNHRVSTATRQVDRTLCRLAARSLRITPGAASRLTLGSIAPIRWRASRTPIAPTRINSSRRTTATRASAG